MVLSCIVLGELYFGANKSARISENLRRIEEFIADYLLLGCDKGTAEIYGRVKNQLRSKGRPIPENDIWIAAQAIQHGLTLVTRDEHFKKVDGLTLKAW